MVKVISQAVLVKGLSKRGSALPFPVKLLINPSVFCYHLPINDDRAHARDIFVGETRLTEK